MQSFRLFRDDDPIIECAGSVSFDPMYTIGIGRHNGTRRGVEMAMKAGETWKFELLDPQADRVFLVKDCDGGICSWLAMELGVAGRWEVTTTLEPGHYRLRYFRAEGNTFFNAGSAGLTGHRIAGDDPTVTLESTGLLEAV